MQDGADPGAPAGGERLVTMRLPARPDILKLIREAVRAAAQVAGCGKACSEDVVIAVNEACMNVIQHAYSDDGAGDLVLELSVAKGMLEVRLTDFADPVDPEVIKPRPLDELRPGGLGTRFIDQCMDEVRFVTPPPEGAGNLLWMSKRIA